jgi:transposase-like protein
MSGLPPLLAEIAEGAGLAAALKLGQDKANKRVYIPAVATADHWLTQLVGLDAAAWICQRYAGDRLLIPPTLVGQARWRRDTIIRMTDEGGTVMEIAASIGIARSTVQRTRERRKRAPASLPLFDR